MSPNMNIGNYLGSFNPHKENPERRVHEAFNTVCARAGVSCMIGMNPNTYNRFYSLKNVGKKLVRVEYDHRVIFIEPDQSITLEVDMLNGDGVVLPRVDALNNGL